MEKTIMTSGTLTAKLICNTATAVVKPFGNIEENFLYFQNPYASDGSVGPRRMIDGQRVTVIAGAFLEPTFEDTVAYDIEKFGLEIFQAQVGTVLVRAETPETINLHAMKLAKKIGDDQWEVTEWINKLH